ncbi:hypothetical protein DFH09DRAFT_1330884 [Mycena vulgaris]|nr:hypothetical protein DFH09DRAFT_1330884 [Mycena vulgaris]
MALAFVEHNAGAKVARLIRGGIEIPEVTAKDNPKINFGPSRDNDLLIQRESADGGAPHSN